MTDCGALGMTALPLGIGVGILKYRLYEIDRLICRTLSYAMLTGLLVGVFVGLVLLDAPRAALLLAGRRRRLDARRRRAFNPLRAGPAPRRPPLQPRPLRRRATVAAFTARLRDAVDLETVRGGCRRRQPCGRAAHLGIWIRSTAS